MDEKRVRRDAFCLTSKVFRDAAEQLDYLVRLTKSEAKKKRLERGADQLMKLRSFALDIVMDWEG